MKCGIEQAKKEIAAKADIIKELQGKVKETLLVRNRLEEDVAGAKRQCEQKQQSLGILRNLIAKETEKMHQMQEAAQTKRFNSTFERLNICSASVVAAVEQIDRLEKITPDMFEDEKMQQQLEKSKERLKLLEKELHQRRFQAQKSAKAALAEYRNVVEQIHMAMDLEWEMSELKRSDEEEEALAENRNMHLEKTNADLKKRLEVSNKPRYFRKY